MHIFSLSPKPENKRSQLLIFFYLGIASRNQNYVSVVTLLVTAILTIYLQQVLWDTRDPAAKCKAMGPVPLHKAPEISYKPDPSINTNHEGTSYVKIQVQRCRLPVPSCFHFNHGSSDMQSRVPVNWCIKIHLYVKFIASRHFSWKFRNNLMRDDGNECGDDRWVRYILARHYCILF